MHTIEVRKKLKIREEVMYVIAIARAMKIKLPSKVRVITLGAENIYSIYSLDRKGVKRTGPENKFQALQDKKYLL